MLSSLVNLVTNSFSSLAESSYLIYQKKTGSESLLKMDEK